MADRKPLEPQDINTIYADELSAKTYTWKKVKEIVAIAAGTAGGWYAGVGVQKMRNKSAKPATKEVAAKLATELEEHAAAPLKTLKTNHEPLLGAFLGLVVANIVIAYEHWRKMESNRLAIDEINNDVSHMKIRQRTDPELLKENDRLRAMLEEESTPSSVNKNFTAKVKKTDNYSEHVTASTDNIERSPG